MELASAPPPRPVPLLVSGGAAGAEACFGELAERWGLPERHLSFAGHSPARERGLVLLDAATLDEADEALAMLNRRVHAHWERSELMRRVLQAQWHVVRSVEALYVVGVLQADGSVHGGTGWAVDLARHQGIPVSVFDQEQERWIEWDGAGWVDAQPRITAAVFGGTGTRFLMPAGRAAIEALFQRSFGPAPGQTDGPAAPG